MYCLFLYLCMLKFSMFSDIDECTESDSPVCGQICTNTIGSYNCSCMIGYELNLMDSSSCDGKHKFLPLMQLLHRNIVATSYITEKHGILCSYIQYDIVPS